ncbi:ankyrin and het domain protein [Colletotrichum sojae]|uniref:Ankyrin and het domain protein n=1 Tax=Colletotrichum sojae TaxID=2175907 RepID=A0A8H6MUJ6_9PEZI|nr:ankyrin and het domain protein [Colletotrichum sojae]
MYPHECPQCPLLKSVSKTNFAEKNIIVNDINNTMTGIQQPRYTGSWPRPPIMTRPHQQQRSQKTPESVPPEAYDYMRLSPGDFIRYIILAPGGGDDPLVCSIHESHVDMAIFEAISYVWGTPYRDQTLICDEKTLMITLNLQDALRKVRLADRPRTLWADSVCIDQDDPVERGYQVGLMSRIYSRAEQVLVCLGGDPEDSAPEAASLVRDVCSRVLATYPMIDLSPGSFPDPPVDGSLAHDPRWPSVALLLATDWFKRGWVVQECGLARAAVLLWGSSEIPWVAFMRTWLYAERLYKTAGSVAALQPSWEAISFGLNNLHSAAFAATHRPESEAWFPAGHVTVATSPLQMIRDSDGLALADERDRIFAFQSLARRITDTRFRPETPDYRLGLWEVYLGFAKKYVLDTGDLSLLNFVHHDERTIDEAPVSWCPQWNIVVYESGFVTNLERPQPSLPPRLFGDVCAFGALTPLILRETSPGHYRLVGEVYITRKAVCYSESGTREFKMLGDLGSEDWRRWGREEQDIFLV